MPTALREERRGNPFASSPVVQERVVVEPAPPIISERHETDNRYVRVAETDQLGEAFKEAIAAYAQANPQSSHAMQGIEQMAQHIAQGRQTASRLGSAGGGASLRGH